jgi:hypothetical protein
MSGRLVRSPLAAGTTRFSVALDARAKRALRRHGRLALTAKVVLKPASGPAVTLTRALLLHS